MIRFGQALYPGCTCAVVRRCKQKQGLAALHLHLAMRLCPAATAKPWHMQIKGTNMHIAAGNTLLSADLVLSCAVTS